MFSTTVGGSAPLFGNSGGRWRKGRGARRSASKHGFAGMKTILIGYDGSPCAEAAIEQLGLAGLPGNLEVIVMSVADVWLPSSPDNLEPAFPDPIPNSFSAASRSGLLPRRSAQSALSGSVGCDFQQFTATEMDAQTLHSSVACGLLPLLYQKIFEKVHNRVVGQILEFAGVEE
jgi:hypothetical protein